MTKTYRVFGCEGHRQRMSFGKSARYDFTEPNDGPRIIELMCEDMTGTNDYVEVRITRPAGNVIDVLVLYKEG